MNFKFLKEFVCVYFWCQYVQNYCYGDDKRGGTVWPFILTSSLLGIFFHGIYLLACSLFDYSGELHFWAPYVTSWLLGGYATYVLCLKGVSFKEGELYFEPVEKRAKRSSALSFSFLFTCVCFSTRILYFFSMLLWSLWRQ